MKSGKNRRPLASRLHRCYALATLFAFLLMASSALALTIVTPPTFSSSATAPLAGTLRLKTDVPARLSVVVNDGTSTWTKDFLEYSTTPTGMLLGFKPGRFHQITVVVYDRNQNAVTNAHPVIFTTPLLPSDFPNLVLLTNRPELMEPGYTLFRVVNNNSARAFLTIVNNAAEVVWFSSSIPSTLEVKALPNGDLFLPQNYGFLEVNLLGNTVQTWNVPTNWTVNYHEGTITDHNSILFIHDDTRVVTNFPTSTSNSNAPLQATTVLFNWIAELSMTNGSLLNTWSLIDMVQSNRVNYLTYTIFNPALGWDCEHANAVIPDPRDDSVIVSLRHQDAIIKFSRATGKLQWILGPHENWSPDFQPYLLAPVGIPFAWSYAQHAPMLTPQGTLLVYDDGDFRASPFDPGIADADNFSRVVEYRIDEAAMEISQVWDYGRTNSPRIYSDRVGNADWLPQTGNVLITFGNVNYVDGAHPSPFSASATMARIQEVTHGSDPQLVFDLALFNYGNPATTYLGDSAYRSHHVADLYSQIPQPVGDLQLRLNGSDATLLFSGDRSHTYMVEGARELGHWETLGEANFNGGGNYSFTHSEPAGSPTHYYRVLTQ